MNEIINCSLVNSFTSMSKHNFQKLDVTVDDKYIERISNLYIKQRSETKFDYNLIDKSLLFQSHGFNGEQLEKIITQNSVAKDINRDAGKTPAVINDIYRSDLGEMLLTSFFEKKLPEKERFKIPYKNITNRELAQLPGRGIDAVGYRLSNDKIELLIGEAKVSHQVKNPPDVVDYSKDSMHNTQLKFKNNKQELLNKLSDYTRKLSGEDAEKMGIALLLIEFDKNDKYDLVFGCALIRDLNCVKIEDDYGKFYTQKTDFDPHQISFCIVNFNQSIENTVELFYKKVQEICSK